MKPLVKAKHEALTSEKREAIIRNSLRVDPRVTREKVEQSLDEQLNVEVYINSLYQVEKKVIQSNDPKVPSIVWLAVKRRDSQPCRDWRDMQAIKNQLIGPECEAVELYPAESRKVDTGNQYHLWGFADPKYRFPFGFRERLIDYENGASSKQRPEV